MNILIPNLLIWFVSPMRVSPRFFFKQGSIPERPRSFHSAVATLTKRIKRKLKITIKSKQIAPMTLKVEQKMPSGPGPLPPHQHAAVQPGTTPPWTEPLGAQYRELTAAWGPPSWHGSLEVVHLIQSPRKKPKPAMEVGEVALRPLKKAAKDGQTRMLSREQLQCSPVADLPPNNHHQGFSLPQHHLDQPTR
jgi:hypothetical protein